MASGAAPHLISVVKYEKYALRGVLDFFGGGHILYENMHVQYEYSSTQYSYLMYHTAVYMY